MIGSKKFNFLLALYITAIIASELLGGKVATLFGINFSVAIFALPITFTINDIISEVYGKEKAKQVVRLGLYMLIILLVLTSISTLLPVAARSPVDQKIYEGVFSKSIRIMLASLTAFGLSELFDVFIYNKIKSAFGKKNLWLRNNLSNFLGQLADTTLFMFLAFFDPSKEGHVWFIISLIIPYWILKCVASIVETPFTYLGVYWLKKENSETNIPQHNEAKNLPTGS